MTKDFQVRFLAVLLAMVTAAACVFAWINFQKERQFEKPYDGVWWVENGGHLLAQRVDVDGPGSRGGIRVGDLVTAVNDADIKNVGSLTRQLYRTGTYSKANYALVRGNVPLNVSVVLVPYDNSIYTGQRLIALVYLGIGLYVLLRRWTAPRATHFYLFCLTSFILYSFHYTGKLNLFDWIIFWSNIVAGLLQPALFLHFVLTFPEKKRVVTQRRWLIPLSYAPAVILLATHIAVIHFIEPSEVLRFALDRLEYGYLAIYFLVAGRRVVAQLLDADTPILRQQMKWVTRGTILGDRSLHPVLCDPVPEWRPADALMKLSVLSLVFLPLTFGYAIFRYRLMDVDLIFKRGMAYTLAAAFIVGVYFAAWPPVCRIRAYESAQCRAGRD